MKRSCDLDINNVAFNTIFFEIFHKVYTQQLSSDKSEMHALLSCRKQPCSSVLQNMFLKFKIHFLEKIRYATNKWKILNMFFELSDCKWTRTQNHLVSKWTLNHLAFWNVYVTWQEHTVQCFWSILLKFQTFK